jgi:hypothetical protein
MMDVASLTPSRAADAAKISSVSRNISFRTPLAYLSHPRTSSAVARESDGRNSLDQTRGLESVIALR